MSPFLPQVKLRKCFLNEITHMTHLFYFFLMPNQYILLMRQMTLPCPATCPPPIKGKSLYLHQTLDLTAYLNHEDKLEPKEKGLVKTQPLARLLKYSCFTQHVENLIHPTLDENICAMIFEYQILILTGCEMNKVPVIFCQVLI